MKTNRALRLLKHLLLPGWWVRRSFDRSVRTAIKSAVRASERRHRGELRFVAEGPLPLAYLLSGASPRARAVDLFSQLRIWDTEDNSGVLIYVQLVDQQVEILADRGIAAKVSQAEWDGICRRMEKAFRVGDYGTGALAAIVEAGALLEAHFPPGAANPNELPDAPLLL